jgi:HEAT repeat protein
VICTDSLTKQARKTLFVALKLAVLCLMLLLLWTSNSWAQIPTDARIAPIIEKLIDNNARVRLEAHDALVSIGSPAVPALIEVLKNPDCNIRWRAAWVLGDMASEANAAVGALAEALQDEDAQVRMYAALALGEIGKAAKLAVPPLMAALQDREEYVRIYAASALRRLGTEAKVAVPSLMNALKDKNPRVRKNAALALGAMGSEATSAVGDVIPLLQDNEYYVRYGAVKGLAGIIGGYQDIADNLPSAKLTKVISDFEKVLKILEDNQDKFTELDTAKIRRPLEALKAEKETRLFDRAVEWLLKHKLLLGIAAYITLLPSLWLILLRVTPLWLLKLNNALKPYTDFSLPLISINVPLRYVLFVGWFHYHPRVLDAWVEKYIHSVREQFPKKDTVNSRATYVPIPAILDGNTVPQLTPENLRSTFGKKRSCLVICGEGGVGKTSLACQIARWAIAETKDQRLCEHLMLPVLLEEEFRVVENKSSLLEAIRGQLQALIDEPVSLPENVPSLMLGYLNELNRDITADKLDDRTVHQDAKVLAWECLQASYQPGNAKRTDAVAALTALGVDNPETRLDYLENRLHLIQTIGSAKDQFRFCLDPLAEYLAALYVVEIYSNNDQKWRSQFFRKADDLFKTGKQDAIKGFLLAVRECYLTQVENAKDSDFAPQKLSKLTGVTTTVNPLPSSV